MNNVEIKKKEQNTIINRAIKYLMNNQNLDIEMAVEDAIIETVPDALKHDECRDSYLAVSGDVLQGIKAEVRKRIEEKENNTDTEEVRFCLCGCGLLARKGRKFRQGHDAKLASILRKVESGKLDKSHIPEVARRELVPCKCCGKLIIPHKSGMCPTCRTGINVVKKGGTK